MPFTGRCCAGRRRCAAWLAGLRELTGGCSVAILAVLLPVVMQVVVGLVAARGREVGSPPEVSAHARLR